VDIEAAVRACLGGQAGIASVRLMGSRAGGRPTPLSDWDFEVATSEPDGVTDALPGLVEPMNPILEQFDRLSYTTCYMLLLPGAVKVDLIFPDIPWEKLPPWEASAETLAGIDAHFWDWIIWLGSKVVKDDARVPAQYELMSQHLLVPMGEAEVPESIEEAVTLYRRAREAREREFGVHSPREAEDAVCGRLRKEGFAV
jgi:hypothetical protein